MLRILSKKNNFQLIHVTDVVWMHIMSNGHPPLPPLTSNHMAICFKAYRLSRALLMVLVAWQTTKALKWYVKHCTAYYNSCKVKQLGPLSHLLVCLEDVLSGDRAHSCAQRLDHSICHLCAHTGGIGVQDAEVALVTLDHQLQRAPLGVHAADVYCTLLTPPASTCRPTNQGVNSIWQVKKMMYRLHN